MESNLTAIQSNKNNYEQPAPPAYDSVPYTIPMQPVLPPPPPYSAEQQTGQFRAPPLTRSSTWSRGKKIRVTVSTIVVKVVVIVAIVLIRVFVTRHVIHSNPPTCQMYCRFSLNCIYPSQICDGIADCIYRDDEENCGPLILPSFSTCQMYCSYSFICVSANQICDGVADCIYGDDEENCVRLYGADFQLQVYSTLKSAWLPVCSNNWTNNYGALACQDIGYSGRSNIRSGTLNSTYAPNGYFQLNNGSWTSKLHASVQYSSSCSSGYVVSLHCTSCGVSYNNANSLTVGGTNTSLGNWPWQVSLRQKRGALCGGSIISPKWIVTAAHCVYGVNSSTSGWKVFAGALTLPSYDDASGFSVERIIVFPGYNSSDNANDIAVMKLTKEITFSSNIQPVCLPNSGMFWEAGTQCWISGWGTTSPVGNNSATLKWEAVQLISSKACNQSAVYNGAITPSMICADHHIDSCQEDSGGPLVTKTNGTWWLVGDASWGVSCSQPNKPGVYVNMTMFVEWIYLQMRIYM